MAELTVRVSKELKERIEEFPEIKKTIREFIKLKIMELELKRSRELQRFVFETLSSKSKLTKQGAAELASKINRGLAAELKEKGLA